MTWIEKLFGSVKVDHSSQPQVQSEVVAVQKVLTSMDQEKAPFIAGFALLAAQLAGADLDISPGEKQRVSEVLQKQTQISKTEADAATEVATAQELANAIEHFKITQLINEMATREQKLDIIRGLFYIACDDDISEIESNKIRTIATALSISEPEFFNIRSEFNAYRSLLKR